MLFMTYAADITDTSQYILQEAFTKVGHELEATQENLIMGQMVSDMIRREVFKEGLVPGNFHSPQPP